ncbi:MAG: hypothetical protein WED05_04130 [Candidatus Atabeyarchaeum deiterrae]
MKIRSAKVFKDVGQVGVRILESIEIGMRRYEFVPVDEVLKVTRLPENDLNFHLSNLLRNELIRGRVAPYKGYVLTEAGYDCLAFNALVKQNVLEAIGPPVGVGKECTCLQSATKPEWLAVPSLRRIQSGLDIRRKRCY